MRAADYTTVIAQGSPGYLAPIDPACTTELRYMVVHRVSGGGWAIVDRRTGRLLVKPGSPDRFTSWGEAQAATRGLNTLSAR